MKKGLFTLIITLFIISIMTTGAMAKQNRADLKKVWGGGDPKSSTYSGKYVPHVIDILGQNRLSGYSWAGKSEGTTMNAQKVTENPTHLAVGQLDILRNLNGKPIPGGEGNYSFTILHENIGPEALFAITTNPNYKTWGDILSNAWDLTFYTGGAKSGSYGTLMGLMDIYPDLEDIEVVHAGGSMKIISAVKNDPSGFGFFVMRPDPNSDVFKAIDKAGLTMVPVVDFELEDLYEFMELKVANGGIFGKAKYHTTAVTSVALITGSLESVNPKNKNYRRLQATIKRVGQLNQETLKPNLKGWKDMFDSMKKIAGNKAKAMMEASKKAASAAREKLEEKLQ